MQYVNRPVTVSVLLTGLGRIRRFGIFLALIPCCRYRCVLRQAYRRSPKKARNQGKPDQRFPFQIFECNFMEQ
jgi:hypothetical protein